MTLLNVTFPSRRFGAGLGVPGLFLAASAWWRAYRSVRQTERALARLDDRLLKDIGLARGATLGSYASDSDR